MLNTKGVNREDGRVDHQREEHDLRRKRLKAKKDESTLKRKRSEAVVGRIRTGLQAEYVGKEGGVGGREN